VYALMAGYEPAGSGHDSPPGKIAVVRLQQIAHRPRRAWVPGFGGHLTVRQHLTRRDRLDDRSDGVAKGRLHDHE
jgi:hypothetical protein